MYSLGFYPSPVGLVPAHLANVMENIQQQQYKKSTEHFRLNFFFTVSIS